MEKTNRKKRNRVVVYIIGLMILALGITLNTKTGLGADPITSVSYSISYVGNLNFGNTTLTMYIIYVAVQFLIKGKNAKLFDIFQIPMSIIFTRFLNIFSALLPEGPQVLWKQLLLLTIAVVLTGVGIGMSVNMRLIPSPGDGIVQTISDCMHWEMGRVKNMFDLGNLIFTIIFGIVSGHPLTGIGVGTVITMIGVGQVISVYDYFCKKPVNKLAGVE